MKKALAGLVALCLLATVCLPALAGGANDQLYAVVKGGWLVLREKPSKSGRIISSYPSGTWVELRGMGSDEYYRVTADDGRIGYMAANYLNVDGCQTGNYATVAGPNRYVNLRTGASTQSGIIQRVYNGNSVEVLKYGDVFSRVRTTDNEVGYMSSGLLRFPGQNTWVESSVRSPNRGRVNLRRAPRESATILGSFVSGTSAIILVRGKVWHKVAINGQLGYMMALYLR